MVWPRFVFPWALVLLIVVPWSIWMGVRIRSLSTARKWLAIALRTLILLALIGALAGAELVKSNDKLAVFFLLDQSNSIPEAACLGAVAAVKNISDLYMTGRDEAGIIAFGEEASIELSVAPSLEFDRILSYVGGEQTDAAAAIRLAMAAFPQGYMRRIVLFSDGNETQGSALEEAKLAQAAGVEVDVVPLMIEGGNEVRIREASAPSRVNAGEPFQVRVVVTADQDCEGTMRLYQRTREGKRMLAPTEVTLRKGDNVFLLPQELGASGFYEYEASIESGADTVLANNKARAFTIIYGKPTVLYVDSDPEHSVYLEPALREEGVDVLRVGLGDMPTSLAQFQNYDAVVLSNVASTDLSSDQLHGIEALVRDLGIGLVMVGGPDAFGAGGFHGTPVEKALPLSMDLKQRKVLPRGALVLIMHTCEIPDGNAWAREIGLASLNVLSSHDLMGALAWLGVGEDWIFGLQPVGDKSLMRGALMQANPGDMPLMGPTLRMAYDALKTADAAAKRIIVISDGDPGAPSGSLIRAIIDTQVSVSTVCIAPHSMSDQNMLKKIAKATGGEYYYVNDPQKLPQIFTKEAAVVKSGILIEEEFTPAVRHDSELLLGFHEGPFPTLQGYVATTPKENATIPLVTHKDDPLLAHWRYGLGKSVAFTSDVTNRWAAEWLGWDGFDRFWAQTVRWAMRDVTRSNFRVETKAKDGRGYVKIDAVDDEGNFVNFLRPEGVVTGPEPHFARHDVALTQTGPGVYEGTFPVDDPGVYMMNLTYENPDGSNGMIPAGLAMNYSREYEYNTTNLPYLEQIAAVGAGELLGSADNPFEHKNLSAAPTVTAVWQYLAAFAACLFPFEVFVRRIMIDFYAIYAVLLALLGRVPGLGKLLPSPMRRPPPVTGAYGAMPAREFVYASSGEGAVGFDTSGKAQVFQPGEMGTVPSERSEMGRSTVSPPPARRPGSSEYTRQLLAAKERALQQTTRRGRGKSTDKENS